MPDMQPTSEFATQDVSELTEHGHGLTRRGESVSVRVESPTKDESRTLICSSQSAMLEVLPAEEIFSLDSEALSAPNVTFFVARKSGAAVGCVALLDQGTYGEVKRLFVQPTAQGKGVATMLMGELERYSRDIGLCHLKLETSAALARAVTLYEHLGYAHCPAFGSYAPIPSSLFMEKRFSVG